MPQRTKKITAALGVSALVIVGLDTYTYAGTGDSLILGKFNKAGRTTHVTNTGTGPALSLHAKGGRPALAVDSKAKVVRLNADLVDGRHADSLRNNVRVFTATSGSTTDGTLEFQLPDFPRGRYQATYSVYMEGATGTYENPTSGRCDFRSDAGHFAGYTLSDTTSGNVVGLSSSAVIVRRAADWRLACFAFQRNVGGIPWSVASHEPIQVTLTRIDNTIGGNLTHARSRLPAS